MDSLLTLILVGFCSGIIGGIPVVTMTVIIGVKAFREVRSDIRHFKGARADSSLAVLLACMISLSLLVSLGCQLWALIYVGTIVIG